MTSDRLDAALRELADALREEVRAELTPVGSIPDRLMSIDEASAALSLGRSLLYRELQAGRLRSCKVGRRRLISGGAIADYIAGRRQ